MKLKEIINMELNKPNIVDFESLRVWWHIHDRCRNIIFNSLLYRIAQVLKQAIYIIQNSLHFPYYQVIQKLKTNMSNLFTKTTGANLNNCELALNEERVIETPAGLNLRNNMRISLSLDFIE